jgi:large subunit ribosomal protein L21
MYAIIQDGGKQYKVSEGDVIDVERRDLPKGTTEVQFDQVLLTSDEDGDVKIGTPVVPGARVTAAVEAEVKGQKIDIVTWRRRKSSMTRKGHRQKYLRVKITGIES